jgi:hypothetical protein
MSTPAELVGLRETIILSLANGDSWSQALRVAGQNHPECVTEINGLANLPDEADLGGRRVLFGEPPRFSSARKRELFRAAAWFGLPAIEFAVVGLVASLLSRKVMQSLCALSQLTGCARLQSWVSLAATLSGLGFIAAIIALVATWRRPPPGRLRLARAAKLAGLGIGVASALGAVYGPGPVSGVGAIALRADDARHSAAVQWLVDASTSLAPSTRARTVIGVVVTASVWILGLVVAGSIYSIVFRLGGVS